MNVHRVALLFLAIALVLAPLGVCLGGGEAMAASHASSQMHVPNPEAHAHEGHGETSPDHFCPECVPPSFVKAGKANPADLAPAELSPVIVVLRPVETNRPTVSRRDLRAGPSTFHPPPLRANRIRLQI